MVKRVLLAMPLCKYIDIIQLIWIFAKFEILINPLSLNALIQ